MSRAAAEHPLTGFGGGFLSVARKVAENPQNLAKAPPGGRPWRVLDSPNFSDLWRPSSQPMPVFCAKHRFVGRFSTRHSDGGEKGCQGRNRMDAKRAVENGIFFQWIFFGGFAEKSTSFFPFDSSSVSVWSKLDWRMNGPAARKLSFELCIRYSRIEYISDSEVTGCGCAAEALAEKQEEVLRRPIQGTVYKCIGNSCRRPPWHRSRVDRWCVTVASAEAP